MKIYGFVAEPHRNNYHIISPATKDSETGLVTCHDLAGFCGSWNMHDGGVFFECTEGEPFDQVAMDKASAYCKQKNGEYK